MPGPALPPPDSDYWYTPTAAVTAAGVPVSSETTLGVPAAYAAVRVISETVAMLPFGLWRRVAAGRVPANDHPLARVFRQPNVWQTSQQFREVVTAHAALRGTAYVEMRGTSYDTLQLIPIHPDRVQVIGWDETGFPSVFRVRNAVDGGTRTMGPSQLLRVMGPFGGRSPVELHRQSLGVSIALQHSAAAFFGNGSRPGGFLKSATPLTDQQREENRVAWERAHRGPANGHRVAVLDAGLSWENVALTNADAQFLESRQFSVSEIARIWGIPPFKLQDYGRATWGNTEQQAIEFLNALLPWFRRWEEAVAFHLLPDDELDLEARFDIDDILRADFKTRMQGYQIAVLSGWLTRNEVRREEGMNTLPGLDDPLLPSGKSPPKGVADDAEEADDTGATETTAETAVPVKALRAVWDAWANGVAVAVARAEAEMLERAPADAVRRADYVRVQVEKKHRAYVTRRLSEMADRWYGATSLEDAIEAVVAGGIAWALRGDETVNDRALHVQQTLTFRMFTQEATND